MDARAAPMSGSDRHLFWKPGGARPAAVAHDALERDARDDGTASSVVFNPHRGLSLSQQRLRLPIYANRRELLYMVSRWRTVVVVGHTGCGKTTQIPQYLHEAGWTAHGCVCCTQPRRVAAISVARWVADEMGCELGAAVGYAVRFDEKWDRATTRLKFMTDGLLLSEMASDPLLSRYSVVMVDEAHERSVQTDVLLGLLKKILRRRDDLRLVVASATVDARRFQQFFEGVGRPPPPPCGEPMPPPRADGGVGETSAIISLRGSGVHPVALHFTEEPVNDYLQQAVETAWEVHAREGEGDVLVFLTGQQEVESAVSLLNDRALSTPHAQRPHRRLLALPLYSTLPPAAQLAALEPAPRGTRKVVVATNVAETSLTIDGVCFVIDCGLTKSRYSDPRTGQEALIVTPESRANSRQRVGRAGRTRPGEAYVLMPESSFHGLDAHSPPEMVRCSLAAVTLQLKALGISNVLRFDFLSPPPPLALANALELLFALGAIDERGELTAPVGERMAALPLEPQAAKMLVRAEAEHCTAEAATFAAMLSLQMPFTVHRQADLEKARAPFAVYEGDSITLLNLYRRYARQRDRRGTAGCLAWCRKHKLNEKLLRRATQIAEQLRRQLSRLGVPISSCADRPEAGGTTGTDAVRRAIVGGFFANAAQLEAGGRYRTSHRQAELHLHPNSVLFRVPPASIVFHETVMGSQRMSVLSATKVEPQWCAEIAADFFEWRAADGPALKRARVAERYTMGDGTAG